MRRSLCVLSALFCEQKQLVTNKMKLSSNFKDWRFKEPPVYAELPIDTNPEYNVPMAVKDAVFSKVPTEPLQGQLHLVCASDACLTDVLDLDPALAETEEFIDFVAGKYRPEGGLSVSHRYGGYQFGFWSDQLGDGRAHILGEYVNSKGESWQPQLKGSGETPYSRFGDGRAVLRSSIREMVASEACYFLGIPTTRAAALVVSDDHKVWRDKSYTGHNRQERAAVVMRLAPCWYRLGSVEILDKRKESHTMKMLVDHIIQIGRRRSQSMARQVYPGHNRQERAAVVMQLAPCWYRLGYVEILDKRKEPHTIKMLVDHIIQHYYPLIDSNDTDKYVKWYSEVALKNLDMVATWQGNGFTHGVLNTDNVSVLGLTIDYGPYGFMDHYNQFYTPNTSDDMGRYSYYKQPDIILWNLEKFALALEPILSEGDKQKIAEFRTTLEEYSRRKVLQTYISKLGLQDIHEGDEGLVQDLLQQMQDTMADFTCTFRQLGDVEPSNLLEKRKLESKWSLLKVSEAKRWGDWVRKYQERLLKENVTEEERRSRMARVNPVYIPRNWMLQEAIADAENNDFEKVRFLLKIFKTPFDVNEEAEKRGYSNQPPSWSYGLKLSCSS